MLCPTRLLPQSGVLASRTCNLACRRSPRGAGDPWQRAWQLPGSPTANPGAAAGFQAWRGLGPAEHTQNAVGVAGTRVYKLPDRAGSTACIFVEAFGGSGPTLGWTRSRTRAGLLCTAGQDRTGLCHLLFGGRLVILGILPVSLLVDVVRSAVIICLQPVSHSRCPSRLFFGCVGVDSNRSLVYLPHRLSLSHLPGTCHRGTHNKHERIPHQASRPRGAGPQRVLAQAQGETRRQAAVGSQPGQVQQARRAPPALPLSRVALPHPGAGSRIQETPVAQSGPGVCRIACRRDGPWRARGQETVSRRRHGQRCPPTGRGPRGGMSCVFPSQQ